MKRLAGVLLLAVMLVPLSALPTQSQEKTGQEKQAEATATEAKPFLLDVSKARAKTGRVPNGMGKLGLTRDQKERIYGIQEAYDARQKALEDELAQLKAEEIAQMNNVLSAPQQDAYKKYTELSPASRSSK